MGKWIYVLGTGRTIIVKKRREDEYPLHQSSSCYGLTPSITFRIAQSSELSILLISWGVMSINCFPMDLLAAASICNADIVRKSN